MTVAQKAKQWYLHHIHNVGKPVYWDNKIEYGYYEGIYIITSKPDSKNFINIYNQKVGHRTVPSFYVKPIDTYQEATELEHLATHIPIVYKTIYDLRNGMTDYLKTIQSEKAFYETVDYTDVWLYTLSMLDRVYKQGLAFGTGHYDRSAYKETMNHMRDYLEQKRQDGIIHESVYGNIQTVYDYLLSYAHELGRKQYQTY